jgi:hypothetical protein
MENDLAALMEMDIGLIDIGADQLKTQASCTNCLAGQAKVSVLKRNDKHVYRRAFSETNLLDALDADFYTGTSYHCLSGGDVDSLSYLKHILRQQDLDYLLLSTWCMAFDDVMQLREWVTSGKIKRLDAYCGEIFPGSYGQQHHELKKVVDLCQGRVAIFRNHAKIYAGRGDKFSFAVESSANINTNPRTENTTITVGAEIFAFYKDFFDGIKSYLRDYDHWTPWRAIP